MKKVIVIAALTLMSSSAFAQTTGPAGQTETNKPMTNSMDNKPMNGGMDKGSMSNTTGMDKGNPKKEMSKDGSLADGSKDTMKK